ncbi:MAG TPA: hypothetical protein VG992_04570 [Candidatus Saccharimonadales bacterium]|nr:hypothetical protein [Candidatus Saccharimonadales bacterium]
MSHTLGRHEVKRQVELAYAERDEQFQHQVEEDLMMMLLSTRGITFLRTSSLPAPKTHRRWQPRSASTHRPVHADPRALHERRHRRHAHHQTLDLRAQVTQLLAQEPSALFA